ncbi:hypothetical protein ACJRPK_16025 [Aquimarina sp. 2-A2]|uniref:hypothetical protein n=1 Tax=Aquimarina sp. 2-A2 TaxID=3382644 RepID=UPI00387F17A3
MKKQLLFILCLLQVAFVFSQNFPVRVTPQGIPPYPNSLSAYDNTDQLRSPINLLIEFNDLTAASRAVQLKVSIEGTNITAISKAVITGAPNITLDAGFPLRLTNAELAPYFALQNLQSISAQQYNNTLPDGLYRICFEVFDAFNGNKLSNTGCTNIFLVSSDPPFLNRPENQTNLTEQNPTNILFQWTPRHAAVPNVSYEFSLVEIWDRYADPQAVFLASPPIYQDITTATNLLYGPIQPLLLPGKRYAWRVRAIATNAGEEVSVFKNNGYSEIFWFDHASDCTPVSAVQVQDATLTTATISWIGQPEHLDYTIKYREKDGNRWYTKTTPRDYITIEEFRPDTVYEFVVLGNCDSESYGESPLQEFRTLTQELAEYTDCGIAPEDVDLSNQELLTELRKNDVFTAGDFPVYVKKVSGSTTFSGEGYISTPWLATVRIPVTFDNIKINTDKKLVDGFVITTYDPNWGSILDADAVIEEATGDPGDKNVIKVDFDIIDVQVSKDGKTVTLIGKDGQEVVREGGKDVVYQDSKGENWEVSADGTVNKSQQADGGPATTETTAGMGGSGVNEITSTEVRIHFEKGNGYYAFDPYPTVTTGTLNDAYTTIDIAGDGTYYPPYKAISNLPGHSTDMLLAKATFQNSEYTTEDIVFKTKEGTEIPAEWAGNTATLTLEKKFDFVKEEIIATVKPKDSTQQYTIAGTANYWHLASQEVTDINVTLVPVNGASLNGIAERINQIYNPAGINFEVTEGSPLAISDPTIDVGNSTLLSQYTDGEKAWIEQFKALGSYERDTYYLFVTDIPPTDADTDGFMPLKRQFGFVFAGQDKGRTAAHELGHGVFGLEHTFTEYNTDQGATNLLMDYGNGTAFTHMDWEKMHAPGLQLYWFQGDEDGENYSTRGYFKDLQFGQNDDSNKTFTFLTPSQELLVLPNNVSNVTKFYGYYGNSLFDDLSKFNQFMTVVPGTIAKFTVEDKTYKARIVELGENEYSLKEYSTDNGEVYELSDYNIELNEKNSAKAIIFGVHESDRYSYHALIINGNYSHFSENSRIVPVKDFIVQIDAETQTKSLDIQYSGSQYSITNEAVNWVFAEANYSTSDKTFLLRNKILELKSLYPRLLDEISSQFGNWNRQNLCSGGGKFELLLRQEYCDPQTSQREGTTSYSIKTDADISDSAESWLSKFYDYLKANVNNEANNIASSLLDYKTIPGKIEEDNSQSIAYVINIASQNDIGQLSAETILKIISKFVNETFTQESNRAKYDLEGAIIKLIQYANKNINKPIIEGIEKPNILNPDKVLSEQIFYAVDDAFLFFGSDNKNVLIRELTKKMFNSQELYDARLSDAINDIEKRSFVFEYTNVVGRALVEIGNISSEQLTYGFIEAPLSDYYQTETINKDFITDKNDSNFGKIKLTQLTQSGFRNVTIDDKTKFKVDYSNEEYFKPFDLIFLTNKSNLTSAKAFESGVGFDPKIYPIPAIAVAYVSQSGENQTTADGIFTVIDVASLAVSGGALNIATNLTRARRIFYTADVISSMASIGATSVSDNAELNELKNILQITSALSGIVSLGDNVSNINFKNLLITAKNKVDEAEEIASDIRKLSQNINQMSSAEVGIFVRKYEKVSDNYLGYALKDLQDAKHANDTDALTLIKQAITKVLDAKSDNRLNAIFKKIDIADQNSLELYEAVNKLEELEKIRFLNDFENTATNELVELAKDPELLEVWKKWGNPENELVKNSGNRIYDISDLKAFKRVYLRKERLITFDDFYNKTLSQIKEVIDLKAEGYKKFAVELFESWDNGYKNNKSITEMQSVYRKYGLDPSQTYPPNEGVWGLLEEPRMPSIDELFDRFQTRESLGGGYAGYLESPDAVATISARALKENYSEIAANGDDYYYFLFKLKETPSDLKFEYGEAMPWFGETGGAIQIKSSKGLHEFGSEIIVVEKWKLVDGAWTQIAGDFPTYSRNGFKVDTESIDNAFTHINDVELNGMGQVKYNNGSLIGCHNINNFRSQTISNGGRIEIITETPKNTSGIVEIEYKVLKNDGSGDFMSKSDGTIKAFTKTTFDPVIFSEFKIKQIGYDAFKNAIANNTFDQLSISRSNRSFSGNVGSMTIEGFYKEVDGDKVISTWWISN